ncbi:transporter substrate-binding domain-containing protein [bacterium]|nr:transporter substrate-binding domain-containing protein [bacterium]
MKSLKSLAFAIILSILVTTTVSAAEEVSFATFPIPLMVVDENNGVFVELANAIASRADLKIKIIIAPPKRTITNFIGNKADVLFPAVDVFFPPDYAYLKSSEPIYIKTDFIFTRKGDPLLKTIESLEGQKVGITRGYPYANELMNNKKIVFDAANGDNFNVLKLMKGRIVAFVVEEKSGLKAFEEAGLLDKMQYDKASPVSKQDVFYSFQTNEKGKRLEKLISRVLLEMKKDGSFGKIMAKAK